MRFQLLKQKVLPNHAYMLRNDGKLFDCGEKSIHPYLLFNGVVESALDVLELLVTDDLARFEFDWLRSHTHHEETKLLFKMVIPDLIILSELEYPEYTSTLRDYFDYTADIPDKDISALDDKIKLLNNELNQEFLRIRVGDKYQNVEEGNDIYFRVSSIEYNWFEDIWSIVNDNKPRLSTVTICKDRDSTGSDACYSHKGQIIENMPVDEFLTLSGEVLIEQTQDNKLLKHKSLQLIFPNSSIKEINYLVKNIRDKELTI